MGLVKASHLQIKVLPELIACSRNKIIACDPGHGKTIALCIGILCHVDVTIQTPQVLVVCATYEAVVQMHLTLLNMAGCTQIGIFPVISDACKE